MELFYITAFYLEPL